MRQSNPQSQQNIEKPVTFQNEQEKEAKLVQKKINERKQRIKQQTILKECNEVEFKQIEDQNQQPNKPHQKQANQKKNPDQIKTVKVPKWKLTGKTLFFTENGAVQEDVSNQDLQGNKKLLIPIELRHETPFGATLSQNEKIDITQHLILPVEIYQKHQHYLSHQNQQNDQELHKFKEKEYKQKQIDKKREVELNRSIKPYQVQFQMGRKFKKEKTMSLDDPTYSKEFLGTSMKISKAYRGNISNSNHNSNVSKQPNAIQNKQSIIMEHYYKQPEKKDATINLSIDNMKQSPPKSKNKQKKYNLSVDSTHLPSTSSLSHNVQSHFSLKSGDLGKTSTTKLPDQSLLYQKPSTSQNLNVQSQTDREHVKRNSCINIQLRKKSYLRAIPSKRSLINMTPQEKNQKTDRDNTNTAFSRKSEAFLSQQKTRAINDSISTVRNRNKSQFARPLNSLKNKGENPEILLNDSKESVKREKEQEDLNQSEINNNSKEIESKQCSLTSMKIIEDNSRMEESQPLIQSKQRGLDSSHINQSNHSPLLSLNVSTQEDTKKHRESLQHLQDENKLNCSKRKNSSLLSIIKSKDEENCNNSQQESQANLKSSAQFSLNLTKEDVKEYEQMRQSYIDKLGLNSPKSLYDYMQKTYIVKLQQHQQENPKKKKNPLHDVEYNGYYYDEHKQEEEKEKEKNNYFYNQFQKFGQKIAGKNFDKRLKTFYKFGYNYVKRDENRLVKKLQTEILDKEPIGCINVVDVWSQQNFDKMYEQAHMLFELDVINAYFQHKQQKIFKSKQSTKAYNQLLDRISHQVEKKNHFEILEMKKSNKAISQSNSKQNLTSIKEQQNLQKHDKTNINHHQNYFNSGTYQKKSKSPSQTLFSTTMQLLSPTKNLQENGSSNISNSQQSNSMKKSLSLKRLRKSQNNFKSGHNFSVTNRSTNYQKWEFNIDEIRKTKEETKQLQSQCLDLVQDIRDKVNDLQQENSVDKKKISNTLLSNQILTLKQDAKLYKFKNTQTSLNLYRDMAIKQSKFNQRYFREKF